MPPKHITRGARLLHRLLKRSLTVVRKRKTQEEPQEKLILRSPSENDDAGAGVLIWVPNPPALHRDSSAAGWYGVSLCEL